MAASALSLEERVTMALRIGESHYREFKSAYEGLPGAKKPRDLKGIKEHIARTLVAFANADGGELLIGIEDDQTISGLPFSQRQIDVLLAAPETNVMADTPLPNVRRMLVNVGNLSVLYFSVSKGTSVVHMTSNGTCLRRVDRDSVPISAETIQAQRFEDESRRWERGAASGVSLADLDLDLVSAVSAQVAYGVTAEKYLQYMELAEFTPDGLRLSKAAVLLFAKDMTKWYPAFSVRIMIFSSNKQGVGGQFNVIYEDRASDNMLKLVDKAWERLNLAISKSIRFVEDEAKFRPSVLFPQAACREALVNAIVHRNYAIEGRGVEISIYPDRMEISSPGMLLSTISLADLRSGSGVHESRNPIMARVLREVGYVREVGEGIRRIQQVMKDNALAEPQFDNSPKGFLVTLYNKPIYDPAVLVWLSNFDGYNFTNEQTAVLALGYRENEFSTQDIMDRLGLVDSGQIPSILNDLMNNGFVFRSKSHNRAYSEAKQKKLPKRAIKCYRVTTKPVAAAAIAKSLQAEKTIEAEEKSVHKIFLANLPYEATKGEIIDLIETDFRVMQLELPSNRFFPGRNRGFGFVTLMSPGTMAEVINKLDGFIWRGKRLHCAQQR
jgi:ATP-dependent DNA helicase RecG